MEYLIRILRMMKENQEQGRQATESPLCLKADALLNQDKRKSQNQEDEKYDSERGSYATC